MGAVPTFSVTPGSCPFIQVKPQSLPLDLQKCGCLGAVESLVLNSYPKLARDLATQFRVAGTTACLKVRRSQISSIRARLTAAILSTRS